MMDDGGWRMDDGWLGGWKRRGEEGQKGMSSVDVLDQGGKCDNYTRWEGITAGEQDGQGWWYIGWNREGGSTSLRTRRANIHGVKRGLGVGVWGSTYCTLYWIATQNCVEPRRQCGIGMSRPTANALPCKPKYFTERPGPVRF